MRRALQNRLGRRLALLSGFVITRTLLADAERGLSAKAMFRRFYLKRSFRILPLYLGSILVFTLAYASFEKIRASTSCSRRSRSSDSGT